MKNGKTTPVFCRIIRRIGKDARQCGYLLSGRSYRLLVTTPIIESIGNLWIILRDLKESFKLHFHKKSSTETAILYVAEFANRHIDSSDTQGKFKSLRTYDIYPSNTRKCRIDCQNERMVNSSSKTEIGSKTEAECGGIFWVIPIALRNDTS